MEPFGLFQILQNLLLPQSANAENPPTEALPQKPAPEAEKTDDFAKARAEFSVSQNEAVLQFFSAHDERVKRTKQKR